MYIIYFEFSYFRLLFVVYVEENESVYFGLLNVERKLRIHLHTNEIKSITESSTRDFRRRFCVVSKLQHLSNSFDAGKQKRTLTHSPLVGQSILLALRWNWYSLFFFSLSQEVNILISLSLNILPISFTNDLMTQWAVSKAFTLCLVSPSSRVTFKSSVVYNSFCITAMAVGCWLNW